MTDKELEEACQQILEKSELDFVIWFYRKAPFFLRNKYREGGYEDLLVVTKNTNEYYNVIYNSSWEYIRHDLGTINVYIILIP